MQTFPSNPSVLTLPGPAGQLEVMTTWPSSAPPSGVGIICHPDPRQQGTMLNKVVTTTARAFENLQLATVRFNFRGIGKSEGSFGNIIGECEDLTAIIKWVQEVLPTQPLWLAGFSFGSYVSAVVAQQVNPIRLISIAPPVNFYDFQALLDIRCPWLVIQGDADEVVPCAQVQAWVENSAVPVKLIIMPDASHFFHGRLIELREHIESWPQKKIPSPRGRGLG